MDSVLTQDDKLIDEGATRTYTTILLKEDEVTPVPLAAIDSLTLTLVEATTGEVINSRDRQDVLNANNVTVHATTGLLTWEIQEEDTAVVVAGDHGSIEVHRATFILTYNGGAKKEPLVIDWRIRRLGEVP